MIDALASVDSPGQPGGPAGEPTSTRLMPDPTLGRMRDLANRWEAQGDRRCVFLNCYGLMTEHVLDGLRAGRFQDPDWVAVLLARFADYYFDALDAYERGRPDVPAVWRCAHDTARQPGAMAAEALLLGVNAHINRDLPLALRDVLADEWATLAPARRDARHRDYALVNALVAETLGPAQRQVVEPYDRLVAVLDRRLRPIVRLVDWEVERTIDAWRDEVWQQAMQLLDPDLAARRPEIERHIEYGALLRAHVILSEIGLREHLIRLPLHELRAVCGRLEDRVCLDHTAA